MGESQNGFPPFSVAPSNAAACEIIVITSKAFLKLVGRSKNIAMSDWENFEEVEEENEEEEGGQVLRFISIIATPTRHVSARQIPPLQHPCTLPKRQN
jgi:hypothetical protein